MTNGADNHAGEELQVHCAAPWISVPQSIILDRNLSDAACRVIIYLLDRSRMKDWKIRIYGDVLPRFEISEYRWPKIRREMELAGYYKSEKIKSRNGSFTQIHHVYYPPLKLKLERPHKSEEGVKPPPSYPGVGDSGLGHPGVGDSGAYSKQSNPKQKSSSMRVARGHAPADAGEGESAAAEPVEKATKETKAFQIIQGVECWTREDPATTAVLLEQHGVVAVASVAAAFRVLGIAPVPGRVARELQRRAAAARDAKKHAAADERALRLEEESRRRGERELAELMALQARQPSEERDE